MNTPIHLRAALRTTFLLAAFAFPTVPVMAAETPKPGDFAPRIEAKDQDGNAWKLSDHLGKEVVLIYFYPKDETPGCTKEACGFRDRITGLKKLDVTVVGVSRDDAESHRKFREKNQLNFPLLVDVDGKVTEAFGASASDRPRSRRVSFLIGKDGKIAHVTDNRDAQVHLDKLHEAVEALRK
jgi:thioredoxin-dependent peroxiredoxin